MCSLLGPIGEHWKQRAGYLNKIVQEFLTKFLVNDDVTSSCSSALQPVLFF